MIESDKKKIIYDASVLVSGNVSGNIHKTGLYRVSYEILANLYKQDLYELLLFDVFYRERELKKYVQKDFPDCYRVNVYSLWYRVLFFPVGDIIDRLRVLENRDGKSIANIPVWLLKNILISIEKVAKKIDKNFFRDGNLSKEIDKCDLYYSTYFPLPEQIRSYKKLKRVYTIHDLIPILHPEYFSSPYNQILVKEVVDQIEESDYVVTFSESTKKDILGYRPELIHDHIFVSPLAASDNFHQVLDEGKRMFILNKYNIPRGKKYLLSVCTLEPRKNLKTLIAAFRELLEDNKIGNLKLVLTGSEGWESNILLQEIIELNDQYKNSVILTGFVPDNELVILYSNAYAFIYPSLYEGFGLPPLEAMQCGIPVIASNTSSIPEVLGDCGILIDPHCKNELIKAIEFLYNDFSLRNTLAQKSLERATLFNWSITANRIIGVFNTVL